MSNASALLLETAVRIGGRIVDSAVWEGNACTWRISRPSPIPGRQNTVETVLAADGLYNGSPGIGLFLLELYRLTRDSRALDAARGALEYARRVRSPDPAVRLSLFSGDIGTALVAARGAEITGDDSWLPLVTERVNGLERELTSDCVLDVIGGTAGVILGTFAIAAIIPTEVFPSALDLALACGNHLERSVTRHPDGWSIPFMDGTKRDLCGYAHGASGLAHAFLELFAHTGDRRWRFAATRSIEYERAFGIHNGRDWPDFRASDVMEAIRSGAVAELAQRRTLDTTSRSYGTMRAWCHGAPGIALARIRAVSLGVDEQSCRNELEMALETAMDASFLDSRANHSLCHGILGNCEALLLADTKLAWKLSREARDPALLAVVERASSGFPWLSGLPGGISDPGLMVGEAGVGHLLLRAFDSSVPSILCVSDWHQLPSAIPESDEDLREQEVRRFMPRTMLAISDAANSSVLRVRIGEALSTQPVRRCIDMLLDDGASLGIPPTDTSIRTALAIERPVMREVLAFDDFLEQYFVELRRPKPDLARLNTATFRLAPYVRLLAFDGSPSDESALRPDSSRTASLFYVVFRRRRRVELRAISAAEHVTLSALVDAKSVEDLVQVLDAATTADDSTRTVVRPFIGKLIAGALAGGIVECVEHSSLE